MFSNIYVKPLNFSFAVEEFGLVNIKTWCISCFKLLHCSLVFINFQEIWSLECIRACSSMWGNYFFMVILLKASLGEKNLRFQICVYRNILEASWKVLLRHKLVHWLYGITCWLLEGFKENLFARCFFSYYFVLIIIQ